MKIELKESQIDDLVKLTLSEERKKRIIIPETWERAPAGKPKDPIGYWKALYDILKKGGIPVQYQYANDPAKSGFMWWGSWIISKDLKVNNGYPIYFYGSDKKYYHFKFKDGIYRGTSDLSKLLLSARFSTYSYPMNLSMFKKSQKEITDELNKDIKAKPGASNAFDTLLGPFLEKNKPASVEYFKSGGDKLVMNYKGKTTQENKQLQFKKNSEIWFTVKTNVMEKKGTWSWDPKSGKPIVKNLNGQTLDIGQVITYPYQQLIAGSVEDEKLAQQIFTELKKAFDYDNDGDWTDYDRTNETLAMNAINKIKNKGILEKLNAKIAAGGFPEIKNVEQWFKLEMSNWDPTEWDVIAKRLNSLGYSVPPAGTIAKIYGYAADKTINMVDKAITAAEDKFNYANKQTAVRKYTEPQALNILETQVSPPVDFLADMILNATRWYGDSENLVARVFSRINTQARYGQIKVIMKQDPMTFIKTFLSTKDIEKPVSANVPSIKASYDGLFADKLKIKQLEGVDPNSPEFAKILKNSLIFTPDNPRGTHPKFVNSMENTVLMNAIKAGQQNDKYIKGDTALVPKDFGWSLNAGIYPVPKPYPMEWINSYKKSVGRLNLETKFRRLTPRQQIIENIVESYKNKYRKKIINEINDNGGASTDRMLKATTDAVATNAKEKRAEEVLLKPIQDMQNWNSELARQKELIPKFCSKPLEYTINTICRSKNLTGAGWTTVNTWKDKEKLSMYNLCSNYGGLWIKGATSSSYTCQCRDNMSPLFGQIEITPRNQEAIKACKGEGYSLYSSINIGSDISWQQSSKDWSDPNAWLEVGKQAVEWGAIVGSLLFPQAAPLIGVIAGVASFGISAAQGDTTAAAIALLFSVLPGLSATLKLEEKLIRSLGTKLIKGGTLTAAEIRGFFTIVNSERAISTLVLGGVGNAKQIALLAGKKITSATPAALKAQIMAARATMQGASALATFGSDKLDPIKVQNLKQNIVTAVANKADQESQEVKTS